METTLELCNTEDGPGKDGDRGDGEGENETLELGGVPEGSVLRVKGIAPLVGAVGEIGAKGDEDEERDDLEGQTANHGVDTLLDIIGSFAGGRHGAADGLQQE